MFKSSPIEKQSFRGIFFYIKRDDLLHNDFSGNKARKFHYYLHNNFPKIKKIISYGSAQSNAMYSLSVLAKMRGWKFNYFVEHIASYLKDNPHGNYKGALDNGMNLIVNSEKLIESNEETLLIEEGGRQKESEFGISILAKEIVEWKKENGIKKLDIFLPSGTGTTALFLSKHCLLLNSNIVIYTTPCVGDAIYLQKQFLELEENKHYHPRVLTAEKKHHFGKLYRENYEIWLELQQQMGVEFDLLYDPLGWRVLLANIKEFKNPILYIHQGGLLGNDSMLPRYKRKYKDLNRR